MIWRASLGFTFSVFYILTLIRMFKALQAHPIWGGFFGTFGYALGVPGHGSRGSLEVGEKFAEGGQAELDHAFFKRGL